MDESSLEKEMNILVDKLRKKTSEEEQYTVKKSIKFNEYEKGVYETIWKAVRALLKQFSHIEAIQGYTDFHPVSIIIETVIGSVLGPWLLNIYVKVFEAQEGFSHEYWFEVDDYIKSTQVFCKNFKKGQESELLECLAEFLVEYESCERIKYRGHNPINIPL